MLLTAHSLTTGCLTLVSGQQGCQGASPFGVGGSRRAPDHECKVIFSSADASVCCVESAAINRRSAISKSDLSLNDIRTWWALG